MESYLSSLFWKGYSIESVDTLSEKHLLLKLKTTNPACCPQCGKSSRRIHDTTIRRVRDCDLLNHKLSIELPVRRVRCETCGIKRERIPWLAPHSRLTTRLVHYVEELCKLLPIKHAAKLLGLSWHTVREIHYFRLKEDLPPVRWDKVRRLMMDEFALRKGHNYASVIADADTRQVLWIGVGRTREAIRPFFKELGEYCSNIEAVAMDQNTAYDLEVKAHCPQAEVVYDLFHVVAKYGREVIDRVRVDQANELREDKPARRAVKRSRWLLLKNRNNLTEKQDVKLSELMAANLPLAQVYVLKEQLKELWRCCSIEAAYQQWEQWWSACYETQLKPLHDFARRLKPYLKGIVSSAKFPLNTSILEGMNNRIKVIKRTAYGYRDHDYFFLKIKHAFPGLRR